MTTPISITIDDSGIHAPPFDQVLQYIQDTYRSIYGQDIDIAPDTQDGQLLGVFSTLLSDMNNACVAAFNSFRPAGAVGAGLSSIVKINGIRRQSATSSRATLEFGGTAGTVIPIGALVSDNLNLQTQWFVLGDIDSRLFGQPPAPLIIPAEGVILGSVICTTPGAISADVGTLTQINTPIPGWQTVTNPEPATLGQPVETDAQLRRRQTQSTAIPAQTVAESITGNVFNLAGVIRAKVYDNDTAFPDTNGIPARTISVVVEGGDPNAIATTIARTKTPGVPTYGSTSIVVYDKYGIPNTIQYWPLALVTTSVLLFINPVHGFTDVIGGYVEDSIAQFLNDLGIGTSILLGDLFSPARLNGDEAILATGLPQATLDTFLPTYSIAAPYGLAVARSDMAATGGPYVAGSNQINVAEPEFFRVGTVVWVTLEDQSYYRTTIIAIEGTTLTFLDPIPTQRSVVAGGLVFAVNDVTIRFNEAAAATASTVLVQLLAAPLPLGVRR